MSDNTDTLNTQWQKHGQFFEYGSEADPNMPPIKIDAFPPSLHEITETRVIPFDLSAQLKTPYPATGPTLLANFVHIAPGDVITTQTHASSQVFYVIRGKGISVFESGELHWKTGDYIALPFSADIEHKALADTAFYWVSDQPLMDYLGVKPFKPQVRPLYFSYEDLEAELAKVSTQNAGQDKNRNGFLLANPDCALTKTITHSMWSLYNLLPAGAKQKAHRHNSIALDYAVRAGPDTYTLIGKAVDDEGNIIDPIRADWVPGAVFVTPPGWWHSHHNEGDQDAVVLPVQDAGLHTYIQSLDIQFSQGY